VTINNPDLYEETWPNWAMLDGCFGGRISAMDIDGLVERHGVFLMMEQKTEDAQIKTAQDLVFRAFARLHPKNVVLAFGTNGRTWPNADYDIIWILRYTRGRREMVVDPSLGALRYLASAWYAEAEAQQKPWLGRPEVFPPHSIIAIGQPVFVRSTV
jgi:hypothetical protein